MSNDQTAGILRAALMQRFGENIAVNPALAGLDALARIASHVVCRSHRRQPVDREVLRLLCACALSAPSKSDLQQADILVLRDATKRRAIADRLPDMLWVRQAPVFLIFLANGRRLKRISQWRQKPFPNDHLDLFFNATVDAAIVLATFIRAAEAAGLGCCPISVIRDHAAEMSRLLDLPGGVIPVAGMCLGWPAEAAAIVPRLGLDVRLHEDRFDDSHLADRIDAYDRRRAALRPYPGQRDPAQWGHAELYGWSEDKARQYAEPQRTGFGAFVWAQGFRLD